MEVWRLYRHKTASPEVLYWVRDRGQVSTWRYPQPVRKGAISVAGTVLEARQPRNTAFEQGVVRKPELSTPCGRFPRTAFMGLYDPVEKA